MAGLRPNLAGRNLAVGLGIANLLWATFIAAQVASSFLGSPAAADLMVPVEVITPLQWVVSVLWDLEEILVMVALGASGLALLARRPLAFPLTVFAAVGRAVVSLLQAAAYYVFFVRPTAEGGRVHIPPAPVLPTALECALALALLAMVTRPSVREALQVQGRFPWIPR